MATSAATITVFQDRQWVGVSRLGAFVVAIDGRGIGVAPVLGTISTEVPPGSHVVRIRQWWFRSPPLAVELHGGDHVRIRADIDRSVGAVRRTAKWLIAPNKALTLERDT